jgi:hypothetical protein
MGSSSKVVIVGAISLIIGVYGASLKGVQTRHLRNAMSSTNRVQRLHAADAALRSSLSLFAKSGDKDVSETKTIPGSNGVFSYSISKHGNVYTDSVNITYPDGSTQLVTGSISKKAFKLGPRKIHKGGYNVTAIFAGVIQKPTK